MPMLPINWSELDQKYWINDVDGDVLWFESSLEAKEAQLEVMLKKAVLDERAAIVAWLQGRAHVWATDTETAEDILAGEHHK